MTFAELMGVSAAVLWALHWWPVGWMLGEWRELMRTHTGPVRLTAEAAGFVLGWVAVVALPLWVLALVRAG